MRKQIAAANWKMNLTVGQAKELLKDILDEKLEITRYQQVVFAVPFPYLIVANEAIAGLEKYSIAAQNCHHLASGAYTGEVSVDMLYSINIRYCIVGHSERRAYFNETNQQLAAKIDLLLSENITPIFCCGESIQTREAQEQNAFVQRQLEESLFHLTPEQIGRIVIAYEPIWAIGTGKTASSQQAQEMHAYIRSALSKQYGDELANDVSILYGGSVKASNAKELFSQPDVDGGLVGGSSLMAQEFIQIISALRKS